MRQAAVAQGIDFDAMLEKTNGPFRPSTGTAGAATALYQAYTFTPVPENAQLLPAEQSIHYAERKKSSSQDDVLSDRQTPESSSNSNRTTVSEEDAAESTKKLISPDTTVQLRQ